MKTIFKVLTGHIAIGALFTFAVFGAIGELPYFSDISDKLWIWLIIPVILILLIWWIAN